MPSAAPCRPAARSLAGATCKALLAIAVAGASATAQAPTLTIVAHAGEVERRGSPVDATLSWPEALAPALVACATDLPVPWTASLVEAEGERVVVCEVLALPASPDSAASAALRFVVDHLPAGTERTYRLILGAEPATPQSAFVATVDGEARTLEQSGGPVLRHEFPFDRNDFERTSKPIWHLYVPGTQTLLTKGVGGEFSHHRGLFLGWNKTGVGDAKFDFWHCPAAGQRHAGYNLRREVQSAVRGDLTTATHWLSPLDEPVVRDRRTITVWQQQQETQSDQDTSTLIDVAIELSADQVVALRGDPQHAGFQLRVADEVAQRKDARYVLPPSAKGSDNDVWSDCPWAAGLFRVGDHDVAVLHMSHPDNPTPLSYSTRDYGRFGAFFEADIAPDRPLTLRYRLLLLRVLDGTDVSVARFARAYADYTQPIAIEIRT